MANFNQIILVGRLTCNPDIRNIDIVKNNKIEIMEVSKFSIATNNIYDKNEVLFINVNCFGTLALNTKYLKKGSQILLVGRLKNNNWIDKKTGLNRNEYFVVAENVQFLDKKKEEQE